MSYLKVSGSKYIGSSKRTTTTTLPPSSKPVSGSVTPVRRPTYVEGSGRLTYSTSSPVYERRPIYQRVLDEKGFSEFAGKKIKGFEEEVGVERAKRESELARVISAKQARFAAREKIQRQLEAGSPSQSVVGKIQAKRTGVFEEKVSARTKKAQEEFGSFFEAKRAETVKDIEAGRKQFERLEVVGYERVPVGTQTQTFVKYTQPEQFASFKETSVPTISTSVKEEQKSDTKGIVASSAPADLLSKLMSAGETPSIDLKKGLDLDVKRSISPTITQPTVLPEKKTFFTLTQAVPGEKIEDLSLKQTILSADWTKLDLATRQKLSSVQKKLEKQASSHDPGLGSIPLLAVTSVAKGAYDVGSTIGRIGVEETKSIFGFGVGLGDIILKKPGAIERGVSFTGPISGTVQDFLKAEALFYKKHGFERYVGTRAGLLAVAPGAAVGLGKEIVRGMGEEIITRPISFSGESVGRLVGFKGLLSVPSKIKTGVIKGAEYLGRVERVPIEFVTTPKAVESLRLTGKGIPIVGDPSKVVSRGIKSTYSKTLRKVYEKISGKKAPTEPVFTKGITGRGAGSFERVTIDPRIQFYEPSGSYFGGDLSTFMFSGSQQTKYTLFGLGEKTIRANKAVTALFTKAKQPPILKMSKQRVVGFISKAEARLGFDPSLISPEAVAFRAKKLLAGGRPPKLGPSLKGGKFTYRDVFGVQTEKAFTVPTKNLGVVEPSPMVQAGLTREVDVLVKTFSTYKRLDVSSNIFQRLLGYKAKIVARVPGGTIEVPLRFAVQDTSLNIAREKAAASLVSQGISPTIEKVNALLKQQGFNVTAWVEPQGAVERFGRSLMYRGVSRSGRMNVVIKPLITPAELSVVRFPKRDVVSRGVVSVDAVRFPIRDVVSRGVVSVDAVREPVRIVSGSGSVSEFTRNYSQSVPNVNYSFNSVSSGKGYEVPSYTVPSYTFPSYTVPRHGVSYRPVPYIKRPTTIPPAYPPAYPPSYPPAYPPAYPPRRVKRKQLEPKKMVFKTPKFKITQPKTTSKLYTDKRLKNIILPIQTDWLKAMNAYDKQVDIKTIPLLPSKRKGFMDLSKLIGL